jgi:hypothetical protein
MATSGPVQGRAGIIRSFNGEREMLKISLIAMFVLSLATLSFAASVIPTVDAHTIHAGH